MHPFLEYAAPAWNSYLAKTVLALEKLSEEPLGLQRRGEMEHEDRLRKLKWSTLERCRFFLGFSCMLKDRFWDEQTKIWRSFFNLSSVTQPALSTRISYMLSKQSVIDINILFLSESCGTVIIYQDLL